MSARLCQGKWLSGLGLRVCQAKCCRFREMGTRCANLTGSEGGVSVRGRTATFGFGLAASTFAAVFAGAAAVFLFNRYAKGMRPSFGFVSIMTEPLQAPLAAVA